MKDAKTTAYVNMFGVLGALEDLCALAPDAKALAQNAALPGGRGVTLGFTVADGPAMRLRFENGLCAASAGADPCGIRLPFGAAQKFNGMIDGTVTPFPNKGFLKLKFLTRNFISLTKILEDYLRPSEDALKDQAFFAASTTVMFFVIARSLAQIANHDEIGRFTASNIPDGTIVLAVGGELPLKAALAVKDHTLSFSRGIPAQYSACMEFSNLQLARRLFDGKVSALACLGEGLISVNGNIGMIDNLNRLLDRVAAYLG